MKRARVGMMLLILLAVLPTAGCSLYRAAPWQGLQALLLEVICWTDTSLNPRNPSCAQPALMLAKITEDPKPGGATDYLPLTVRLPPHLLEQALRASPGDHLELGYDQGRDSPRRLSNHGRPPSRWLDTAAAARSAYETEKAQLREQATRRELQRRVSELARRLQAAAPHVGLTEDLGAAAATPITSVNEATMWQWSDSDV